jgi:hypothetical protein
MVYEIQKKALIEKYPMEGDIQWVIQT